MPDNQRPFDVIVAGELYCDLILSGFEAWPDPGHEAFASHFHREVGGGAAITACAMAKLGSRAAVLGVVGEDGDWLIRELEGGGVATSAIGRDQAEPTAFTVAVSMPQERTLLSYPGANRSFPDNLATAAAGGLFAQARHVHLAFPPDLGGAPELFTAIRESGCTLSLDVGWQERWLADPRLRGVLPLLDIFFPNEAEAQRISGQTDTEAVLRWFAEAGLNRVAVKLGVRGSALLWDGKVRFCPGLNVKGVDTTGAGDCFDAGFLHSWLAGGEPEACLLAGNICGALSTEAYGGVAGAPDAARLKQVSDTRSCEK